MKLVALLVFSALPASTQPRVMESVVPALSYGTATCSSSVQMQNLSDRLVMVDVEGHKPSGALAPMVDHPDISVQLNPHERAAYKLQIDEPTTSAWVKIREHVPGPGLSPVVAVSGATECIIGDELRKGGARRGLSDAESLVLR